MGVEVVPVEGEQRFNLPIVGTEHLSLVRLIALDGFEDVTKGDECAVFSEQTSDFLERVLYREKM